MKDVTVVLTNYKRPENVVEISRVFAKQNPRKTIVVDNSPMDSEFRLPTANLEADDIIRFHENAGPCCRFVAIPLITTPLVLFFDDDMLPAPQCLEHLDWCGEQREWQFSTLGQIGRRYKTCRRGRKYRISRRNVKRSERFEPVDMTCRAHYVQTRFLHHAIAMRTFCMSKGATPEQLNNDDIFLCQGIQAATELPSYLIPSCETEKNIKCTDLPAPHALNARPGHAESRDSLLALCREAGWRSKIC